MAQTLETPEKKQSFDWIYEKENPVSYKTEILDLRSYYSDLNTRDEFDRVILPKIGELMAQRKTGDRKIHITDIGSCFGNTLMAIVRDMTTDQIRENWSNPAKCEKINRPPRFPAHVTGIDLSANALKYCKRTGLCDETITADLNNDASALAKSCVAIRESDIIISAATLVYLNVDAVDKLIESFASGNGEGYAIVNFLNPFELEKSDEMKQILLKHLDFVGSTATQHRTLSDKEKNNYPMFGEWALLEIWVLKRRVKSKL